MALRSTPGSTLRLAGGEPDDALKEARRRRLDGATAEEDGGENDLKAAARRRAEAARNAGSHPRDSVGKTAYRVFFSATNKLGLTVRTVTADNSQRCPRCRSRRSTGPLPTLKTHPAMPHPRCHRTQGSSTRIVNGQVVVRRNLVQKLFHLIYVFFRAIYYFFKTLVVPLSTLEPQKRGSGTARTPTLLHTHASARAQARTRTRTHTTQHNTTQLNTTHHITSHHKGLISSGTRAHCPPPGRSCRVQ